MTQEEIPIILFVHCKTHFCDLPLPIQSRYSIWRPQKQLSTVTRRFVFCFTRIYRFSRRRHQLTKSLYFNNITTPFEARKPSITTPSSLITENDPSLVHHSWLFVCEAEPAIVNFLRVSRPLVSPFILCHDCCKSCRRVHRIYVGTITSEVQWLVNADSPEYPSFDICRQLQIPSLEPVTQHWRKWICHPTLRTR